MYIDPESTPLFVSHFDKTFELARIKKHLFKKRFNEGNLVLPIESWVEL